MALTGHGSWDWCQPPGAGRQRRIGMRNGYGAVDYSVLDVGGFGVGRSELALRAGTNR